SLSHTGTSYLGAPERQNSTAFQVIWPASARHSKASYASLNHPSCHKPDDCSSCEPIVPPYGRCFADESAVRRFPSPVPPPVFHQGLSTGRVAGSIPYSMLQAARSPDSRHAVAELWDGAHNQNTGLELEAHTWLMRNISPCLSRV